MTSHWNGRERRNGQVEPIHPMRWRLLIVWIAIFTLFTGYSLRHERQTTNSVKVLLKSNSEAIHDLAASKAQLSALQKTNCGLKKFLLTARKTRWAGYEQGHNPADLRAVIGYEKLITPFAAHGATGDCKISKSLLIKDRPLPVREG